MKNYIEYLSTSASGFIVPGRTNEKFTQKEVEKIVQCFHDPYEDSRLYFDNDKNVCYQGKIEREPPFLGSPCPPPKH